MNANREDECGIEWSSHAKCESAWSSRRIKGMNAQEMCARVNRSNSRVASATEVQKQQRRRGV